MAQAPTLYQETRLSPAPVIASQILLINTTGEKQPSFAAGRKRGFDEISGLDEESYARKHLATEGSVFFRRKSRAPRSFLWRVLEGRKVLEIQSVDLVHDRSATRSESWLTFRIALPAEVLKNGVAFADPDETDALEAFVLTSDNNIYTFTLKRDLLTRESAPSDFDPTTCFKKFSSNSLSFRHPYRFVAISSLELLVSLQDGGLLRLERQSNQTGTQWRETFFSERGWSGTLRGLVTLRKPQTVKYGNLELDSSAIAAIAKSPDGKHIWTVSLDHELKAWNSQSGTVVVRRDILDERPTEESRKQQKYVMGAEQGTLLQVMTLPRPGNTKSIAKMDEDGIYFLALHSPKDHQVKFYQVTTTFTSVEGEGIILEDLQPSKKLIPPIDELMQTNIWHLEDFYIHPGVDLEESQIWLRARSGTSCRTFALMFSSLLEDSGAADVEEVWQNGWTVVDPGMQTADAFRASADYPGDLESFADGSVTPSEKWLDFIFCPGRFSTASTETALQIYRKGRGLPTGSGGKGLGTSELPLKERLIQAISSKIILKRLPNGYPDYDRYQSDVQAQWKAFSSVLLHLHGRRNESIGLAFDVEDSLPWNICADFIAPVRANSVLETLYLNQHLDLESIDQDVFPKVFPDEEAVNQIQLLGAGKTFCDRLSSDFRRRFRSMIVTEALGHELGDAHQSAERVQALYTASNINAEVMDDDFNVLESAAEGLGGLGSLSDDSFLAALELMAAETKGLGGDKKSLNRFGDKFMVTVAQETLERDRTILLDLLTLVVFMFGDLEEHDLHFDFVAQIGPVYDAIIVRIRHNEMLSWLAKNEVPEQQKQSRQSQSAQPEGTEVPLVTLLERIAIGDWDPKSRHNESLPELLTMWSKQWIYGADLFQEWDGITGHILGFLIKEQFFELAADFRKFLAQEESKSSWAKYLEGRLFVATGDYALASLKFQAVAGEMAHARHIGTTDDVSLLSSEDRNYFGVGQSAFYQHVSSLFDKLKIFSYTADFALLALEHLENDPDFANTLEDLDRRAASTDSPVQTRINMQVDQISLMREALSRRDELRSRLFNALVQTGRFREAFDALAGIGELPMKKANLKELVEKCVKHDAVPDLLSLPFEEARLGQEADGILLGLAKKGLASGSAGSPPYNQLLYVFRTQRSDFRGAAEILFEHLERLRYTQKKHGIQDAKDETLIQAYVLLINTLACCGEENAWLLADPIEEVHGTGKKRRLVSIDEVRRDYGIELDKRSDILHGRFPLVGGGDEMDVL